MPIRINVPVDADDKEISVMLTDAQLAKALAGADAGRAAILVTRDGQAPAKWVARIERVAA